MRAVFRRFQRLGGEARGSVGDEKLNEGMSCRMGIFRISLFRCLSEDFTVFSFHFLRKVS